MQAGIWTYPWDVLDGDPGAVLRDIAGLGCSAVHLAASYHTVQALLPHNPRRRTYLADRAGLYFQPRRELWRDCPLQPALSPLLEEQGDALAIAAPLCRDLGLRLVAWTVCLHNSDLGYRHPQANVVNVRGEPYRYALCPANPHVRAYLHTLVNDLRDRVDAIELEAAHWLPFPHHHHAKLGAPSGAAAQLLLTLCFCQHCRARAAAAGADPDRLADSLSRQLDELLAEPPTGGDVEQIEALQAAEPDLARLLAVREEAITTLVAELARIAGSTPIQAMAPVSGWLTGTDLAALGRVATRLSVLAYGPPRHVAAVVASARGAVGDGERLHVGLSLLHGDTPDEATFVAALAAVRGAGVEHVGLYNYGLAPMERLHWARQALAGRR